ncbi:alpha/beta hydrolase [Parasphingopyxis algicola]|uniref:alpha/beta fold hydrolase n=1 Tax=Parasphingopyxis algicola TaxID=2026624 RepID=UPI0015A09D8E|nr:alpha/beta hydrolase [Parasphingopyxis algicola]QLC24881.1 alpha/beta hydrolase [Parasphingopyxis algicola]
MAGYSPRSHAPALTAQGVDVLVIGGRYDRIATPKIAVELHEAFGSNSAHLTMFEESGHRPWIEEANAYLARLREFLPPNPACPGTTIGNARQESREYSIDREAKSNKLRMQRYRRWVAPSSLSKRNATLSYDPLPG